MIRLKAFLLTAFGFMLLISPGLALAESYSLPEPLVGQAVVTTPDGAKNWFGVAGNEAVFNSDPNFLTGFDEDILLGSDRKGGCNGVADLRGLPLCFALVSKRISAISVMNSRTSLNGAEGIEVAALFWPVNSLQGDAYSTGNYLENFAFYGNNLNKSKADSLSGNYYSWGVKNYEFNPEAQSYYNFNESKAYNNRIAQLRTEAQSIGSEAGGTGWYLQAKNAASFNLSNDGIGSSPEGKVWLYNGALSIAANRTITFHGKGTLIVNGNLTLGSGVNIKLQDPNSDSEMLGIIVLGDVSVGAYSNIRAPIFATGAMTITGNNVSLYGSYVATNFNATGRRGVRFYYDNHLDSVWPPGFRYFNMPTAKNAAQ